MNAIEWQLLKTKSFLPTQTALMIFFFEKKKAGQAKRAKAITHFFR
jgi:hypothetical protein